jgi:uncharacterized membrane protein
MITGQLEKSLEKELHVSWLIVGYKMITGIAELVFGFGILFFGRGVLAIYHSLVSGELLENPRDLLVIMGQRVIPYVFAHNHSLSFFLIMVGLAKVIGAVGLIYKKDWGVDLLIGVTLLFLPFQVWNFVIHHSVPDLVYLLLGIFISLYLINFKPREYSARVLKKMRGSTG